MGIYEDEIDPPNEISEASLEYWARALTQNHLGSDRITIHHLGLIDVSCALEKIQGLYSQGYIPSSIRRHCLSGCVVVDSNSDKMKENFVGICFKLYSSHTDYYYVDIRIGGMPINDGIRILKKYINAIWGEMEWISRTGGDFWACRKILDI